MRIRALDRWSAVSLATTVPSPVHGEPPRPLVDRIARLREIACIDLVEARRGEVDADEIELGRQAARDLGAQIALAIEPMAVAAQWLHAHHTRDRRKQIGQIIAARLDI